MEHNLEQAVRYEQSLKISHYHQFDELALPVRRRERCLFRGILVARDLGIFQNSSAVHVWLARHAVPEERQSGGSTGGGSKRRMPVMVCTS